MTEGKQNYYWDENVDSDGALTSGAWVPFNGVPPEGATTAELTAEEADILDKSLYTREMTEYPESAKEYQPPPSWPTFDWEGKEPRVGPYARVEIDGDEGSWEEYVKLEKAADGSYAAPSGGYHYFDSQESVDRANELLQQQAHLNISLAGAHSPEKEHAALELWRNQGIPLNLARAMDNQDVHLGDMKKASTELKTFFSKDLSNAIMAKDDIPSMDKLLKSVVDYAGNIAQRKEQLLEQMRDGSYTPRQREELLAAGFEPVPGYPTYWKKGGAVYDTPILDKWLTNPVDNSQAPRYEYYTDLRGSASLPENLAVDYIMHLQRENAIMLALHSKYGTFWQDFNDEDLESAVRETGSALGFDEALLAPLTHELKRYRSVEVGAETDWAAAANVFGAVDAARFAQELSTEELLAVAKNPAGFRFEKQAALIDYYEKQARELRGNSWGNTVTEGVLSSVPFAIEFALLGGGAVATKGMSLAARMGVFARTGSKVLLAGIPGRVTPNVIREAYPQLTLKVDPSRRGVIIPTLSEGTDIDIALVNSLIRHTIDTFSEGLGELLPGSSLVKRLAPKKMAKSAFGRFMGKVFGGFDKVAKKFGWHGIVPEYLEEVGADAMSSMVTGVAEGLGTEHGNLGVDQVFGGFGGETARIASVVGTGTFLRTAHAALNIGVKRQVRQFADGLRTLQANVEATQTVKRDSIIVETAVRDRLGDKGVALLDPEAALSLFQTSREAMESLGLTEDIIKEADKKGRLIPVDVASVVTRLKGADFEKVLQELSPVAKRVLKVKDAQRAADLALTDEGLEQAEKDLNMRAAQKARENLSALPPERLQELVQSVPADALGVDAEALLRFIQNPANALDVKMEEVAPVLFFLGGIASVTNPSGTSLFQGDTTTVPMEQPEVETKTLTAKLPEGSEGAEVEAALLADEAVRNETKKAMSEVLTQLETLGLPKYAVKAAARLFSMADYFAKHTTSGMTAAEWIRNVAFQKMKEKDWLETFNGGEGSEGPRKGVTTFNDNWEAMITLFEGAADASTLIHEIGHYAFETMRHFVESGIADERMVEDFRTLENWMKLTDKEAAEGYEKYKKSLKEGETPLSVEDWKTREERERLARGFEAYVREGHAPSAELTSAFSVLGEILMRIYKTVRALGVRLNDEVRRVFEGMLATSETLERDSLLLEAIAGINKELLGLTQADVKAYQDLIGKANAQALQELIAEKARQLKELRPQWRKEAEALMVGDPVYNAWRAIEKEGGIDFIQLAEIVGENMAKALHKKGLTTAPGRKVKTGKTLAEQYPNAKAGKHPMVFAAASGFADVDTMALELSSAMSPSAFVKDYLMGSEMAFNAEFDMSEAAQSTLATRDLMEALVNNLSTAAGREGRVLQRAALAREVRQEISEMSVAQILNGKELTNSCRDNLSTLMQSLKKKDYLTALTSSQKLRYNLELMRQKGAAQRTIRQLQELMRKGVRAQKGSIDGDYHQAIIDLASRFGFPTWKRKAPAGAALAVVEGYNRVAQSADGNGTGIEANPAFFTEAVNYRALSFGDAEQLYNLVQFLYGEGKYKVSEAREKERREAAAIIDALNGEMAEQEHSHVRGGLSVANVTDWVSVPGTKIRNLLEKAARWNADSAFIKELLNPMIVAAGEQDILMAEPGRIIGECLRALRKSSDSWDLGRIANVRFPDSVKALGYTKWDVEKVLMTCLNMGTFNNRSRLLNGFGWTEEDLGRVASLLSAEDWQNVQRIWDAIGKGKLAKRVRDTFKEIYHYAMSSEEAEAFSTMTRDGVVVEVAGGYFPLAYLLHESKKERNDEDGQTAYSQPAFRRATFTYKRVSGVTDPVDLSLRRLHQHVFDTSHYVSHAKTMRRLLRIVSTPSFMLEFGQTQGFHRYRALVKLMKNVAAPGEWLHGEVGKVEKWLRAAFTASALWGNAQTVIKQLAGATVGVDELGHYFFEGYREFYGDPAGNSKLITDLSGLMRDRANRIDLDIQKAAEKFETGKLATAKRVINTLHGAGYAPMKAVDFMVSAPLWLAAYRKAKAEAERRLTNEKEIEKEAIAFADEFVAKTQGANRALDMSTAQLTSIGRVALSFIGATSAVSTMTVKSLDKLVHGKGSFASLMCTLVAPAMISALVSALFSGFDDDDDMDRPLRTFLKELLTSPFSGVPYVGSALEATAEGSLAQMFGTSGYRSGDVFEAPTLAWVSEMYENLFKKAGKEIEDNPDRAAYIIADSLSQLTKVPVLKAYSRLQNQFERWGFKEALPDLDGSLDRKKKKKRRKW